MENYGKINYLTVDIETIPNSDPDYEQLKTKKELKELVPKSYSGKKVDEWVDKTYDEQRDKLDTEHRKKALNSLEGRIFCIAYKYNDNETKCVTYDPKEERMMEKFELALENDIGGRDLAAACWLGHNIKFDLRFIAHRAMKYGRDKLLRWLPTGKWDKRVQDTNELFNLFSYGCYEKLDNIAKFFCLDGKVGLSGDKVYDAFLEGKYDKIHEYCIGDVDLTKKIFDIIMHGVTEDIKKIKI
jgi:predicted PolB exonuclease-like 3'-5' exonuclease